MLTGMHAWLARFQARLTETFPGRVAFLGLQGSRSRGEETETSDIDVVVVLDELHPEDIRRYRAMLDALPERQLICGFLSGWEELTRWEPSDLFQFCHDTTPIIGSLEGILASVTPKAVTRAVLIGACNIYHGCVHTLCHGRSEAHLRELYKSACFVLQAQHYLRTGEYLRRKDALLPALSGLDARVLDTAIRLRAGEPVEFEPMAELLFQWAQGVVAPPWRSLETAHFTLFYTDADQSLADRMRQLIDSAYDRVVRDLDLTAAQEKYAFYLCPDVNAYMAITGHTEDTYEGWMVGWANYEQKRLCILSPRVVKDRPAAAMDQVITHEIVHIAMDALRPGDECPSWLGEGIATLYAGQTYVSNADACPLIRDLADETRFVSLGGYDIAGVYVWYLIKKYGLERFKRVYRGDEPAEAALYPGFEREAVAAYLAR